MIVTHKNIIDFENTELSISKNNNIAIIFVTIILFIVYCLLLFDSYGTNNIFIVMANSHSSFFYGDLIKNERSYNQSVQIMRLIRSIASSYTILFSYNIVTNNKKNSFTLFLPIFLYLLTLLLKGSRHNFILSILAIFLFSYICYIKNKNYRNEKISGRYIFWGLVLLSLLLFFFLTLAPILGQDTNNNGIAYLSFYFGASIPSLNEVLVSPQNYALSYPQYWGFNVFRGFFVLLNKIGLIDVEFPKQIGWVIFSQKYASNVFTAPFIFYLDFGYAGVIFLSMIEGYIYTSLYKKVKNAKIIDYKAMVLFIYFMPGLFNWYRTEDFFSSDITTLSTYLLILISILLLRFRNTRIYLFDNFKKFWLKK